jgi:hypothetical protein
MSYISPLERPVAKASADLQAAEDLRRKHVPSYYESCRFRQVTAQPYDLLSEDTPLFVECLHREFRRQSEECQGQCALVGRQYGLAGVSINIGADK